MAVVKFVSDKNCQLFIDMEYVGDVYAGKILKITLDVGSFLVEGKDANGSIIGKYKMIVNPTDTQVLENLSENFNGIDAVINKLRNDSSLLFFYHRAIFCYNGNYGYINSQYKMAIEPIYSYGENFTNGKALVKKVFPDGEKATVIDINGNICLNRWFDYIGSNDKTILLKNVNTYYVLSAEDYEVKNIYYDAKYDGKADLIPVHKEVGIDDMYGFIDNCGSEVVPFIYDYVYNFDETGFAKVKRFGISHYVDKEGNLYEYEKETINKDTRVYENENTIDYELINVLSKERSKIRGFEILPLLLYPLKVNGLWGFGGYYPVETENSFLWKPINKIVKYECDRILSYDWYHLAYRKNGICKLLYDITGFTFDKGKEFSIEADEIIPNFNKYEYDVGNDSTHVNSIIIKKNKKYGIVDLRGVILLPIEYDLIEPTDAVQDNVVGNIGIVWKEGMCSFVWMATGELLEHFKYESIIVNKASCSTWPR